MRRVEILRAACCVAGADLTIAEAEKPLLDRLAREAGVGFASLEAMMERATQNEDFYREQFRVLSADPKMTMTLLFKVAISDRQLDPQEVKILKFLATQLEVSGDQFERWLQQTREFLKKKNNS
ncbi:MAG: hypothetical protein VYA11_06575 [Planctomycetota bacterium]|nr:hypothetical protein [Planctomycetota bacterium]